MAATVVTVTPKRVSFGNGGSLVETWIIDDPLTRTMPAEERQFYQETILKKSTTNSTMSSSASSQSGSLHHNGTPGTGGGIDKKSEDMSPHPASRGGGKQNGTTHHVTFAESPTEHGINYNSTDQSGGEEDSYNNYTVINKNGAQSAHNGHAHKNPNGTSSHVIITNNPSPGGGISPTTSQGTPLPPIIKLQRSASTESHENPFLADGELSKKADYIISHSTISRTELKIEDPDQARKAAAAAAAAAEAAAAEEQITANAVPTVQSSPPPADNSRPNDISVNKDQNGKVDEQPIAPSSVEVVEKGKAANPEPEQAEEVKVKDSKKCKCCTIM